MQFYHRSIRMKILANSELFSFYSFTLLLRLKTVNSEMDNVKVKECTSLVMVVNMKDLGVTEDILVSVFVRGKMVGVTKGTSRELTYLRLGSFYIYIPNRAQSPFFIANG